MSSSNKSYFEGGFHSDYAIARDPRWGFVYMGDREFTVFRLPPLQHGDSIGPSLMALPIENRFEFCITLGCCALVDQSCHFNEPLAHARIDELLNYPKLKGFLGGGHRWVLISASWYECALFYAQGSPSELAAVVRQLSKSVVRDFYSKSVGGGFLTSTQFARVAGHASDFMRQCGAIRGPSLIRDLLAAHNLSCFAVSCGQWKQIVADVLMEQPHP